MNFGRAFRTLNKQSYQSLSAKQPPTHFMVTQLEKLDNINSEVKITTVPQEVPQPNAMHEDPAILLRSEHKPEIVLIQYPLMHYLSRQRYVAQEFAKRDPDKTISQSKVPLDYPQPLSWQECILNLGTIDIINSIKSGKNPSIEQGLAGWDYQMNDKMTSEELMRKTEKFQKLINLHVTGKEVLSHPYLDSVLIHSLTQSNRVILGDMPETLLRIQLGNMMSLSRAQEIFSDLLHQLSERYKDPSKEPITLEELTLQLYPELFIQPRDLYMSTLLREAAGEFDSALAFIQPTHYHGVQEFWASPPEGATFAQSVFIPDRLPSETEEESIEKQVIFDMMLDSQVWAAKYMQNPFPYLRKEKNDFEKQELKHFKRIFFDCVKKYEQIRDEALFIPIEHLSAEQHQAWEEYKRESK